MARTEIITVRRPRAPGVFARVLTMARALRSSWSGPITSNSPEIARLFGGGPVTAGVSVTEDSALGVAAFWSAVQLIAGDCASFPLPLYQKNTDGSRTRLTKDPLYAVLDSVANPEMSAQSVREMITASALVAGNGYAEIVRDGANRVVELWPLIPARVRPFRERGTLLYAVGGQSGGDVVLPASSMFHLHGLSFDGTSGVSVVQMARESLGLSIAAERFGASFFGNGSTFGGMLQTDKALTELARKNLKESIERGHKGVDRAHRLVLLEDGVKFQKIGIPPNDAQFLETRTFQITEVARWFNLPPPKLQEFGRATWGNFSESNLDYYQSCLRRWLTRWESEITLKLVPSAKRASVFAEHIVEAMLRGDISTRYSAYKTGRDGGWLSANDIRRMENFDPIEGGDTYLVPANMSTIGGTSSTTASPRMTADRLSEIQVVLREQMVDRLNWLIEREGDRARRALASPEKLRAWIGQFYAAYDDLCRKILRGPIRAWLVCNDRADELDALLDAFIARHIERSRAELTTVAGEHDAETLAPALEKILRRWEESRATSTIEYLIQHGTAPPAQPAPPTERPRLPSRSVSMLEKWHKTQIARTS